MMGWSTTQGVIALSSGEAEYYGMVKGASQALGMKSMMTDFDIEVKIEVKTDSSAAKGMATRKGSGKVRHIEVCQLWLQELSSKGKIRITKVRGDRNYADILTKHVDKKTMDRYVTEMSMRWEEGRHPLAPELKRQQAL